MANQASEIIVFVCLVGGAVSYGLLLETGIAGCCGGLSGCYGLDSS